ncbi:IclR family transcriptional regulator [Rhodococcus opacus]|uniref:IclR family transcriptional regulator n=2 Tax=Rhodococcus opacus TaxID=37919 RepID=UPI002896B996|nr:IclR family transcriptional regulator [Rhodococcus opacus]
MEGRRVMETMTLTRRRGSDGSLKSVSTALELLDCFESTGELGVTDLARRLGVAKSTTHRLLTTLSGSGLIEQNPETGLYRLGLHLLELGQLAKRRLRLRTAALPLLEELRQRTGHTVHLAVPEGPDVLYVERLVSLSGVQLFEDLPHRLPAHCTSAGKVIAAFNPDFARLRDTAGFPARTSQTIRTSADWQKTLNVVRGQGIAFTRDEASMGITSVAAPVRDHTGRARAAIAIIGATREFAHSAERPARLVVLASSKLGQTLCL